MDIYSTEEEQVEAIKKWWKDNAKLIIGGILIGLALIYGGKTWLGQKNSHIEQASAAFEAMTQDIQQNKSSEAGEKGSLLLGQFADTPYATMAALAMAKIKVDEDNLVAAKSHLRWALDHADKEEIKHIARLRLTRVLIAEKNYDEALSTISSIDYGKYTAAYEELKGDIYVAKNNIDLAIGAYTLALQNLEPTSRLRQYIQIKLDNLGEAETIESASGNI